MGEVWGKLGTKRENMGLMWGKFGLFGALLIISRLQGGYRKVADFYVICSIAGRNTVANSSRGIAATKREQMGTNGNK